MLIESFDCIIIQSLKKESASLSSLDFVFYFYFSLNTGDESGFLPAWALKCSVLLWRVVDSTETLGFYNYYKFYSI